MTEDSHPDTAIGVIGGSGLYELEGLTDIEEIAVETPFGEPSDAIISGRIAESASSPATAEDIESSPRN